jgi:hypothetical protein
MKWPWLWPWQWRKVRHVADLPAHVRDDMELMGETLLSFAQIIPMESANHPLYKYRIEPLRSQTIGWLREQRDIHERKEQRVEFVEWLIVIFVFVEMVISITDFITNVLAVGF